METRTAPIAVAVMGPTASGKSRLALALCARFPVEIISVDSAQVYCGMDIGTAKSGLEDRAAVPHHLIDIIDPTEVYSAARFRDDATRLIGEIRARGRLPLLVGGTMLYFKALREGLSNLPQANEQIRAQIEMEAGLHGWPHLHAELAQVDPAAAARIKRGDIQRIQRALEVYRITGTPLSDLIARARSGGAPLPTLGIALAPSDRAELHRHIAIRLDTMLQTGLVEELRMLRARFALLPDMPSMRCVGYRQAWQHLEGELSALELRERAVYATRQLAKRQLTWIRATPGLTLFDSADANLVEKACRHIAEHLPASGRP